MILLDAKNLTYTFSVPRVGGGDPTVLSQHDIGK